MNRISPAARRAFFILIYATALVVWVALVLDTVSLAQQAASPPTPTPEATTLPATGTPSAVAAAPTAAPTAQPTVAPEAVTPRAGSIHPKTGRYIAAWLPNSFNPENRQSFEENADILDEVSPFWYSTNASGTLYHGSDARDKALIDLAHSKNVLVLPTIHNVVTVDPIPALLSSPERRHRHVRNIVDEVMTHNYDGIDIDYEGLSSSLRDEYTAFITELAAALHKENKLLSIAVHAKTSDYGGLGGYQDWAALGKVVDRLRIMTYDYHWRGGGAGPVAPVYWVEQVAEYAKSVVDPGKVVIGVPFYGYNWPSGGGTAMAQLWTDINDRIQASKLEVNFLESDRNGLVQENWITYNGPGGRRTVWFSTRRGLEAKLSLVQQYDLAGIAIWRLGGEDPGNWEAIRSKLVEDPFESQRMVNQFLPEH